MKETAQDLKLERDAIKKAQTKGIQQMENLVKQTETTGASISSRIQEIEERISGVEGTIKEMLYLKHT